MEPAIACGRAGARSSPDLVDDFAVFLTGGWATVFNTWIVEGADPLVPEAFTDRLMRMLSVVVETTGEHVKSHPDREHRR
jgi:hypothetical protein